MTGAATAAATGSDSTDDQQAAAAAAATAQTGAAQPGDVETRARRMGWRPKEEFRGNPADWIEANAFVERGENELPVLRQNYRQLDQRYGKLERELTDTKGLLNDSRQTLTELAEMSRKSEERAYKRAKAELQHELEDRASKGDVAGVRATQAEIAELEATAPKKPAAAAATATTETRQPVTRQEAIPPEVTQWVEAPDQEWYRSNAALRQEAIALHGVLARTQPNLTVAENLAEVRRRMTLAYPALFTNPRRQEAAAVADPASQPATRSASSKAKTFNDLPAEAKKACDRFVRTIPGYKREDYVKEYFAGEE